jgi:hypothetical protein
MGNCQQSPQKALTKSRKDRIGDNEPFIDTLDYIFLSCSSNVKDDDVDWHVHSVKSLPHCDEAGGPFPNMDNSEPSDHILIAADLELNAM